MVRVAGRAAAARLWRACATRRRGYGGRPPGRARSHARNEGKVAEYAPRRVRASARAAARHSWRRARAARMAAMRAHGGMNGGAQRLARQAKYVNGVAPARETNL